MIVRIGLGVLAAFELMVGVWNQFFPESFYENFPTVDITPPFSEHYARDFGGATLGLAIVLVIACIRPTPLLVLAASLAYSAFSLPHFVFHLEHLDGTTPLEGVVLTGGNALLALIGAALAVWAVRRLRRVHLAA